MKNYSQRRSNPLWDVPRIILLREIVEAMLMTYTVGCVGQPIKKSGAYPSQTSLAAISNPGMEWNTWPVVGLDGYVGPEPRIDSLCETASASSDCAAICHLL